jgi:phosphoheptose isomerase
MTEHPTIERGLGPEAAADLAGAALALARRFAAGATMWCVAPEFPEHARHVAVEFVHPVIMGKRALPAVAVDDADTVRALRAVARPGDILCAVSTASAATVSEAMVRARVWGLTTVWIGAGARPDAGVADHVLWVDGNGDQAAYDGSLVLQYHVLWELTHVCFEHPGLLGPDDGAACDTDDTCITCSDEGTLAEVVSVDVTGAASVRTAGGVERIDVNLVAPVGPGDLVLVHAGTAIALVGSASG